MLCTLCAPTAHAHAHKHLHMQLHMHMQCMPPPARQAPFITTAQIQAVKGLIKQRCIGVPIGQGNLIKYAASRQ